jgi:hypothetical protein
VFQKTKNPLNAAVGVSFFEAPSNNRGKNTLGNMTSNYTTLIGAGLFHSR